MSSEYPHESVNKILDVFLNSAARNLGRDFEDVRISLGYEAKVAIMEGVALGANYATQPFRKTQS